jgi:hypothetical protein
MKITLLIMLMSAWLTAWSCDHCNVFLNMTPTDYKNSVGMQFRTRNLQGTYNQTGTALYTKHGNHGSLDLAGKTLRESYSRYELSGSFFIRDVWNIQAIIPLVNNTQYIDGLAKYDVLGIGDPLLITQRQLYNTKDVKDTTFFTQRVLAGLGVKLPFGKINRTYPNGTPNLDLQTGSGSWDGLVLITYIVKYKNVGLFVNVNGKFNSTNEQDYRYGTTWNNSSYFFYQIKFNNKMMLMPTIGSYIEHAKNDRENNRLDTSSGGKYYMADLGAMIFVNKLRFSANFQPVIALNTNSNTQLPLKNRLLISLNYNF